MYLLFIEEKLNMQISRCLQVRQEKKMQSLSSFFSRYLYPLLQSVDIHFSSGLKAHKYSPMFVGLIMTNTAWEIHLNVFLVMSHFKWNDWPFLYFPSICTLILLKGKQHFTYPNTYTYFSTYISVSRESLYMLNIHENLTFLWILSIC